MKDTLTIKKALSSMGEYHRIAEELVTLQQEIILTTDEHKIDKKSYERGYVDGLAFAIGVRTEGRKERKQF